MLTPQTLLSHLEQSLNTLNTGVRDAPERQRTLRHTIDWGHSLPEPDEQIMFARFATFFWRVHPRCCRTRLESGADQ